MSYWRVSGVVLLDIQAYRNVSEGCCIVMVLHHHRLARDRNLENPGGAHRYIAIARCRQNLSEQC
jgi:hypothetical protein